MECGTTGLNGTCDGTGDFAKPLQGENESMVLLFKLLIPPINYKYKPNYI